MSRPLAAATNITVTANGDAEQIARYSIERNSGQRKQSIAHPAAQDGGPGLVLNGHGPSQ